MKSLLRDTYSNPKERERSNERNEKRVEQRPQDEICAFRKQYRQERKQVIVDI